jgi:hypothetical protein
MNSNLKPKERVVLIVRSHVESNSGGKLRVVRLEPSKAGTRLLTSKSVSISAGEQLTVRNEPSRASRTRTKETA